MNRRVFVGNTILSIGKCKQIYKYLTVESTTHKSFIIKIPITIPIKKQNKKLITKNPVKLSRIFLSSILIYLVIILSIS